jgi:hypothetical protein
MLNIEESLKNFYFYFKQRDFYLKVFNYSICTFIFLEILRSEISEVKLLQLIPGFYLILLFTSFLFLVILSNNYEYIPFIVDNKKEFGTKTKDKLNYIISLKKRIFLILIIFPIGFIFFLPLSLDSFNSYSEKTLENLWSLDEVLNLEILLIFFLVILSQIPFFLLNYFTTEKHLLFLPNYWKLLIFLFVIFCGVITPTIDGYTQANFSLSAFFLYILLLTFIQRRINIKQNGINSFS